MKNIELLSKKILEFQLALNKWAKKNGVIEESEQILLTTTVHSLVVVQSASEYLGMNPRDFFSKDRLMSVGLTKPNAMRAHNCMWNACARDEYHKYREEPIQTMKKFLFLYGTVPQLYRIKNMGKVCVSGVVQLIHKAGLHVTGA